MAEHRRPPERIETEGLLLRRHRAEDASGIAAAIEESLPELGKWLPWATEPAAQAEAQRRRLEEVIPNWERGTEYVYLIFRSGKSRVLGCAGLHRRSGPTVVEIGYWLRSSETGQGTMTRAVRALAEVALALPGAERAEIHCDQANKKSAAVPRRLGFRLARTERAGVKAPGEVGRHMIWVLESASQTATSVTVDHRGER
ncbi:MAG: GNAT family N-acetyltransferase [Acidimicrobiales bacterium]